MKRLVEFPMDDGGTIIVEVNDWEEERGQRRVARDEEGPEQSSQSFEQAIARIRPTTEKVIATLRGLFQPPDEVQMEFGFTLSAKFGAILTSASADANYKVTLRWKGEDKSKKSDASDVSSLQGVP